MTRNRCSNQIAYAPRILGCRERIAPAKKHMLQALSGGWNESSGEIVYRCQSMFIMKDKLVRLGSFVRKPVATTTVKYNDDFREIRRSTKFLIQWIKSDEPLRSGPAVKFPIRRNNTGTHESARNYQVLPRCISANLAEAALVKLKGWCRLK
jgi:hypothetical protein